MMKFGSVAILLLLSSLAQAKMYPGTKEAEAIAYAVEKELPIAYINKK